MHTPDPPATGRRLALRRLAAAVAAPALGACAPELPAPAYAPAPPEATVRVLVHPLQTLAVADRGHSVLAIAGEDEDFCGQLPVPREGPVADGG